MDGYWNGEPAKFVGVIYQVSPPQVATWWQAMYIGEERQGIEITYSGETWIIDNEYGDGFFKVTRGMGSPRCPHRSIDAPMKLREIPESEINKILDKIGLEGERLKFDKWLEENYPEQARKSKALREAFKNKKF